MDQTLRKAHYHPTKNPTLTQEVIVAPIFETGKLRLAASMGRVKTSHPSVQAAGGK